MSRNTEHAQCLPEKYTYYSACNRLALVKYCKAMGISGISSLSKSQLIAKLVESGMPPPPLQEKDLLTQLRPLARLFKDEEIKQSTATKERELLRSKVLVAIGNSMSNLPYLANKENPSRREIMAMQAIAANIETLHDVLQTSPICQAGAQTQYNSSIHEGPMDISEGEICIAVSTGIQEGDRVILRAIVATLKK